MRSHSDIVKAVGADKIASLTGSPITTVRSWAQRNSIPSDHWRILVQEKHTTADELMARVEKAKVAA
jgi:hypothetical protein